MSPQRKSALLLILTGVVVAVTCYACPSPAECVYAMIPPLTLAFYLCGAPDLREALKRLRPGVAVAVGLFALSLGIALLFLGPKLILSWRLWLEVGACLYYLTAAVIVLLLVRRSLLACASALHERRRFSPAVRLLICEAAPPVLFVTFALPYAMAFAQVHRFKLPNVRDPGICFQRDFEEVEFASADGTRLRGWWIPARTSSERTLIICHGVAANRSIFLPFAEIGDWTNANVLMFDLRGHGESGGRTVTYGYREKEDVLAAIAYARRERPEQAREVIGMGISMGAASLVEAAAIAEPPLDAVILESSFTSTRDMSANIIDAFPRAAHPWLVTLGLPMADWHAGCAMTSVCPEASIDRLRAPVLFLHSRGDSLIPAEHAQRLYDSACEPKHLCVLAAPGHCDGFFADRLRYRNAIKRLMSNVPTPPRGR